MRDYKSEAENQGNSRVAYSGGYEDVLRSWAENFMHEITLEWVEYMESITNHSKETMEANNNLIEEYQAKVDFIVRKIEEEAKTERDLFFVKKQAEDKYKSFLVSPQLYKTEIQYLELVDQINEMKTNGNEAMQEEQKEVLEKLISSKNALEKQHEEYIYKIEQRELAKQELDESESNYKKFQNYLKVSQYTKTKRDEAQKILSVYQKIRDYNQKVVFDDAQKLKNEFCRELNSDNTVTQMVKKAKSSMQIASNGQMNSGEFTPSDLMLYASYFVEEMSKFSVKGFNFVKNAILQYNENVSEDNIIKINFVDIPFQKFLTNIINNFSRTMLGSAHKALDFVVRERNTHFSLNETIDDGEGGKTTKLDLLNEDDIQHGGEQINDYNVIDPSSKKLFEEIKNHLSKSPQKDKIFRIILECFKKKLPPRALFYNPSSMLKTKFKNSLDKIFDGMGTELNRDNYVHPRLKNIIIDAMGGAEETAIINKMVNIIQYVVRYEFVSYMIEKIEKSIEDNNGRANRKTEQLLDSLKMNNKRTYSKLQSESRIANQNSN